MNAAQIAALRRRHYRTQAALAEAVGVTQAAVSQWESGERTPSGPAKKILTALADAERAAKKISKSR